MRLFLLLGMIGMFSVPLRAEEVTIGSGTTTTNLAPIYTYFNYSLTQQIYSADEIGTGGTINSIGFKYVHSTDKDFDVVVYMKHVSIDGFSATTDYVSLSTSDQVFSGVMQARTGWVTITLDTPFEYDGTSNLLIAVDRNSVSWYSNDTWEYTNTVNGGKYTMWYAGDDSNDINPLGSPTGRGVSYNRPNLQLNIEPASVSCAKPKNFAASNVTTNSATLTWTAGGEESNWDVYVTTTQTDVPDESTTPSYQVTTTSMSLENLSAQTNYYAYVRANCGGSDGASKWASTSFTTTRVALNVSATEPYENGFETENGWTFTNGTLTNQWCWGSATNNGGEKAMYVSNDNGTSNAYTLTSAAVVFASKLFNFAEKATMTTFVWH